MFYRQVKNFLGGNLFVESRGTGVGLLEVSLTLFCSSISLPWSAAEIFNRSTERVATEQRHWTTNTSINFVVPLSFKF